MPVIDTFDVLILIARPAAGKSEIIRYLHQTPLEVRRRRFHVGDFQEIDDFPMLWTWFEEDDLLQQMGLPRLHSTPDQYFTDKAYWNLLIRRISFEYEKRLRDFPRSEERPTTVIEFSRGKEHGGYREAFQHLSEKVLANAAILSLRVSSAESLRKNRRRFNPDRPDSILEHGLSDEKMERLYKENDWDELTAGSPDYLNIQGKPVPYVVFENEDDVTTRSGEPLGNRLEACLVKLWQLRTCR